TGDVAPLLRLATGRVRDLLPLAGRPQRGPGLDPDDAARLLVDDRREEARGVVAAPAGVTAELLVPLPELDRDHVRARARVDPDGERRGAVRRRDLGDAAGVETQPLGRLRVDLDPGDPGSLADRVGQLLEPGAVRRPAVVEAVGRVGHEPQVAVDGEVGFA